MCGICGKINNEFLCKKCENLLNEQAKFMIEKSNKINDYFSEHLYVFQYDGLIRQIILDYKFNEKSYIYMTIVNFLLKNEKFFKKIESYDTIIPVPISKKRMKQRGYNQSLLISKEMVRQMDKNKKNIILNKNCLFKTKDIIEQSKLSKEQRLKNIQNVYNIKNKNKLENKKILLIDDIYTTGSTVNECCKTLKQAEPKEIAVLTIAKD